MFLLNKKYILIGMYFLFNNNVINYSTWTDILLDNTCIEKGTLASKAIVFVEFDVFEKMYESLIRNLNVFSDPNGPV